MVFLFLIYLLLFQLFFAGFITDKLPAFRRNLIMSFYILLLIISLMVLSIMNTTKGDVSNVWFSIWVIGLCGFALMGPFSLPAGVISIKFGGKKSCASVSALLDGTACLVSALAAPLGHLANQRGYQYLWGILAGVVCISFIFSILYAFVDRREIRKLKESSLESFTQLDNPTSIQ